MSYASKQSSSIEEDLKAMLNCSDSDGDEEPPVDKAEILKRAKEWQGVPPDLVSAYTTEKKTGKNQHRPPNVWAFPKSECIRHQTDSIPCNCGIGGGFSFLVENIDNKEFAAQIESGDFKVDLEKRRNPAKNIATLIPAELHVKKFYPKGSLELIRDEYTIKAEDHDAHPTRVPSRTPATREDVLRLKDVFHRLLGNAGMGESLSDVVLERRTDSEVQKLIELVRAEQEVYNIVFHEIIRQVTVDCTERGEMLAELRDFYARLLSRIPQIVMSIHQENIVQRSLDRRLMEELLHFKIRLVQVVLGLDNVHQVYQKTKGRMYTAQEELKHALIEAQKSSRISDQLHELYKMQKQRQEHEANSYMTQREFWKNATCSIISKVINIYKLGLFRFLATSLDTWSQHVQQIIEERETKDNEQLDLNFSFLRDWLGKVEDIIAFMNGREQKVFSFASDMWRSMDGVVKQLKAAVNPDPAELQVTPFEGGRPVTLHKALMQWNSQFTIELGQIDSGLEGSDQVEKYLSRLEGIRESWRYQTRTHVMLSVRDENFNNTVGKVSSELFDMMRAAFPLLEEAFFAGIDTAIQKVAVGVRYWAKRNIRAADLGRLQTVMVEWSTSLQRSCDANGFLLWEGRNTTYNVVREKLTEKTDAYKASVIDCLTHTLNKQKMELADLQDRVTQWTVECLTLAAPYHPSIPPSARAYIEQGVSSVTVLAAKQQELKERLRLITDHMDRSWKLVEDQGGRSFGMTEIDPDVFSDMFQAECEAWCGLSDTCIAKLKNREMFQPDVTTRDIGVSTGVEQSVEHRSTSMEDVKPEESVPSTSQGRPPWLAGLANSIQEGNENSPPVSESQIFEVLTPFSSTESRGPSVNPTGDDDTVKPSASRGKRSSLKKTHSSREARKSIAKRTSSQAKKPSTMSTSIRRGSTNASGSRIKTVISSPSGKVGASAADGSDSSARVAAGSSKQLLPTSSTMKRSRAQSSARSSSRLNRAPSRTVPSSSLLSPSSTKRTRPAVSSSKMGSATRLGSSPARRRARPRSISGQRQRQASLVPEPPDSADAYKPSPLHRPLTCHAATEANFPSAPPPPRADQSAQTTFSGHLHCVTFPDFMIELFARQIRQSDSCRRLIETDEERSRTTALQLHEQQLDELQQLLTERETQLQQAHEKLGEAEDEICTLKQKLEMAKLKLKHLTGEDEEQVGSSTGHPVPIESSGTGGTEEAPENHVNDQSENLPSSENQV